MDIYPTVKVDYNLGQLSQTEFKAAKMQAGNVQIKQEQLPKYLLVKSGIIK